MKYLDLTLPSPAANLACEEALLELCEAGGPECLRFWVAREPFVVLGYANRIARETRLAVAEAQGIPVLRRISGGGTVVQGPGVFNYAVILSTDRPGLEGISQTNRYVLERVRAAVEAASGQAVVRRGDTDLCLAERKFSGNAQRRGRHALIFHGSLLIEPDFELMAALLPLPSRQPDYRAGRSHRDFLTALPVPMEWLKTRLRAAWHADEPLESVPHRRIAALVAQKYSQPAWNRKF